MVVNTPRTQLAQASKFTRPLLQGWVLSSGEDAFAHAQGVIRILEDSSADTQTQAAVFLCYSCWRLQQPEEVVARAFGASLARLAVEAFRLMQLQQRLPLQREATQQVEHVRKMLLAFSRDIRVVVLHLAARLQQLRFLAHNRCAVDTALAQESLQVFAPLANRLGLGQIKWQMEDLSLRFLEPEVYHGIAHKLQHKRHARESHVRTLQTFVDKGLHRLGLQAQVQGRAKHIYSVVKKMRGKNLSFHQVMDIFALRILVEKEADCYNALAWLHQHFQPVYGEFDDYIAKPKDNGYQSVHTVVRGTDDWPVEIQIRTHAMHAHAEQGGAAHWAYKEAAKGSVVDTYGHKIALLRQLLAWERDLAQQAPLGLLDDRIYVFTPQARLLELPQGATPIDFAYAVHTDLGHRCRGARVNGSLVTLATKLQNAQMVEIISAKQGGPSRDWLNPDLGFLASARARAKVRAWFNAQQLEQTQTQGREWVQRVLQREGKTGFSLEALAQALGCQSTGHLFELAGRDAFSVQQLKRVVSPLDTDEDKDHPNTALTQTLHVGKPASVGARKTAHNPVLVSGVDALMTRLAQCCKPVPPDNLRGFISRGRGVSVHRHDCGNLQRLLHIQPDRIVSVAWSVPAPTSAAAITYPMDIRVYARERQSLLHDIGEVLAREKVQVHAVRTYTNAQQKAVLQFTIAVASTDAFARVARHLQRIRDVISVERI